MSWFEQLGPTGYPLIFCSIVMLGLVIERLLFYCFQTPVGKTGGIFESNRNFDDVLQQLEARKDLIAQGGRQLLQHRTHNRAVRDEVMAQWVNCQSRRFFSHLKWLTLIAVVSPMFGLLGTVLGIIVSFQSIAQHTGPISPALLAEGLWQAMYTTAAGLIIALPALVAVHSFRIWGNARLERLCETLNHLNLMLEGVSPVHAEKGADSKVMEGEPVV